MTFPYFAYGSNMLTRRLSSRVGSVEKVCVGFVSGRTLTFDKRSIDGSGKCDCSPSQNKDDLVYGVLFRVAESGREALDRHEGAGRGYHVEHLTVHRTDGNRNVDALTYVADVNAKDPSLRPYDWYKRHVLSGAEEHDLPAGYIDQFIKTVQSKSDPDDARRAREEVIYP